MSYHDALENFGDDHGFDCEACGGKTYLTFEDGRLKSYQCEECDEHFQVEFEYDDDDYEYDDDDDCYIENEDY